MTNMSSRGHRVLPTDNLNSIKNKIQQHTKEKENQQENIGEGYSSHRKEIELWRQE